MTPPETPADAQSKKYVSPIGIIARERDALKAENERLRAALESIANAEYGTDTPKLRLTAQAALARKEQP